jgi:D-sedoheptulose 7-phosphate isomerase
MAHALAEHQEVMSGLTRQFDRITQAGERLHACLQAGGKILLCGNGGSAADAQHAATELVVRYQEQRRALAAIALTTDTSILTAHANDYGFDGVFARQVEALGRPGDALVAISTSGNSPSILQAARAAREQRITVIGLTGHAGGQLIEHCDLAIQVDSANTARIQEAHIYLLHVWCEWLESRAPT